MKKNLLMLAAVTCCTAATAAPLHKNLPAGPMQQHRQVFSTIMQKQLTGNAALKTTAINKRIIANAYTLNGSLQDSNRYYYSKGRGSVHANAESYFDNYYPTSVDAVQNISSDSSVNWHIMQGDLIRFSAKIYNYNTANQPVNMLMKNFYYMQGYDLAYNSSANLNLVTISDTFGGTPYEPKIKSYYLYNGQNKRITDSLVELQTFSNVSRQAYTRDANGNVLMTESYFFNGITPEVYSRSTFTYDNNNRMLTHVVAYQQSGPNIENVSRDSFAYTGTATQPIYSQSFDWDNVNNQWVNNGQVIYKLNLQNQIDTYYAQQWSGKWDTVERDAYHYDANGLLLYTNAYTYLGKDKFSATPYDQATMYYEDYFPAAVANTTATNDVIIYPNPATDRIQLQTTRGAAVVIINLSGQQVYHNTFSQALSIDVKHLQAGMYILSVHDAEGKPIAQKQFSKL